MKNLNRLFPFALGIVCAWPLAAQAPRYDIELVGPGTLINDMNELGEVVGWTIAGGIGVQVYVGGPGHPFETLPLPEGYQSAWAQGINDAGVVVGSVATGGFPEFGEALAWIPDGGGGYTMQFLGQLPGHTQSVAYDVNNRGDIVGWSITPGFQGGPTVWFNSPSGVMNLGTLGAPSSPKEINDEGVIVGISGGLFDIDTMQATPLPSFPAGWSGFQGWAINDDGELAGTALHGSLRSAAIWTSAGGWESISPRFNFSSLVQAFDINGSAMAYAEVPSPAAHFPGTSGSFGLGALLSPAQQGEWSFIRNLGGAINDAGQIAAIAQHLPSGQSGVAILTPVEVCQDDLGFQGPGLATVTLCGTGLNEGQSSDYEVVDAPASAPGAVFISLPGFANVPVAGGTLVSFGGFAGQAPVSSLPDGSLSFTVPGIPIAFDVVLQSVFVDFSLPRGIAFTNAIEAGFGQ